jgi:probable selenium-dependent hydroxylase accessory protein YqeC
MDIMKIKKINEILHIEKGDVVSIVGSGGKTTLMFELAKELRDRYKVLVTTSTKIYKPSYTDCDYLYTSMQEYHDSIFCCNEKENNVTVLAKEIDLTKNKLIGINDVELEEVINDFDVTLIESDGSKNLPLKGWKKYEPPILLETNKTIGVIPIDVLNKKVDDNFIYGFDEFKRIIGDNQYVDFESIGRICSSELGLFKNSKGKLYLFINRVDTEQNILDSWNLSEYLRTNIVGKPYDFKICFGSLKQGVYYEN